MAQIFCFGDSITYGTNDSVSGGWVTRLRLYLENNLNFKGLIYNLGISGETTDGLMERFERDVQLRLKEIKEEKRKDNIFIFAYGTNDALMVPSRHSFLVDIDTFKDNLINIIKKAKEFGGKIYIFTITPVVDELTINHPNKEKNRKNEFVEKYNNKIWEISKEQNIEVIDMNSAYIEQDYKSLFCKDGLHPNDKGHELIFKTVVKKII